MNTNNAKAPKILVVDDEPVICEILEFNLSGEGYDIICVHSAEEALKMLSPDCSLILLDIMMGGISGYRLAEALRQNGNRIPIIFLTARDTENDMLTGFSVGGDDYIAKPFSIKEVIVRIKAILKRAGNVPEKEERRIVFDDTVIDFELKEMLVENRQIALTKTEFELVALLAENPDRIYSRDEIIDRVWKDTPYITERTVDVHITRIRKKLGDRAALISNSAGFGYRFNISKQ
jgi:DNA-binding response OmpR family regulator